METVEVITRVVCDSIGRRMKCISVEVVGVGGCMVEVLVGSGELVGNELRCGC